MRGGVVSGIAVAVLAASGCGPDATGAAPEPSFAATAPLTATPATSPSWTAVPTVTMPPVDMSASTADLPADGCAPIPRVELTSVGDSVAADLVYYGEQSSTCGYDADGIAVFDSAFRPERALVASDGRLEVAVDEPGSVRVDIRVLEPDVRIASLAPRGDVLSVSDGGYPLTLPGLGCFVVTIGFTTDTRNGQYAALATSSPEGCQPG